MKKILIVEDNKNNLQLMSFILQKNDYKVVEAETGEIALKKAKEEKFDLILMDIQLPGIDGLETTKAIREKDKETPIIALTSYSITNNREDAFNAGCTGYKEKPINPNTIVLELEKYLII